MAGVYGNMMIPLKPRGGALPEYQGSGAPYAPGSGMSGRLSGEGARIAAAAVKVAAQADADRGAALANLAKAGDHAVQMGLKAYGDYEAAVAQNAFNHYQEEEMRLRAELNTLQGKNALGPEGVEARLARWRSDARERLGAELGDISHNMFSRAADKLDAQSDAWATGKVHKENIAFQNTVSEGSILNARNLALENPGDEAALANAVGVIKAEYERMGARSGWDEGFRDAKFAEARGKLAFDRAKALIDSGDISGAERAAGLAMPSGGIGSLAMGHESGGDPGAISRDTGGSKSYGLFQFNNLGGKGTANSFVPALKTAHPALYEALGGGKYAVGSAEFDKAFKQAASGPLRQEMIEAQQEHLQASYLKPVEQKLKGSELFAAFGDNAAMREVMLSTAIQHGPAGANRILREAWGLVDKDADKQAQLEQLITTTYKLRGRPGEFRTALAEQKDDAARERFLGSIKSRYAREAAQALAMAGAGPASLLSPAQKAQLQGSIDAARKRQEVELRQQQEVEDAGLAQTLVQETQDFSAADRMRYVHDRLAEIEDPARRDKVRHSVARDLEFQEERQKAHDMADAMTLFEAGMAGNELPTQFQQRVNASNVSESAKKLAISRYNGKNEENELNLRALDELRLKIDEAERGGKPMSKEEIYSFAYDRRMTMAQTKSALSYLDEGGNLGKLTQSDVDKAYISLQGLKGERVKKEDVPLYLYEAIRHELPTGKPATPREVEAAVARLIVKGTIPGRLWGRNNTTFGEALVAGKQNDFIPGEDRSGFEDPE